MEKVFTDIKIVIAADQNRILPDNACKMPIFGAARCIFSNFNLMNEINWAGEQLPGLVELSMVIPVNMDHFVRK